MLLAEWAVVEGGPAQRCVYKTMQVYAAQEI